MLSLKNFFYFHLQIIEGVGLGKKTDNIFPLELLLYLFLVIAAGDKDLDFRMDLAKLAKGLLPVHVGHDVVQEDAVDRIRVVFENP